MEPARCHLAALAVAVAALPLHLFLSRLPPHPDAVYAAKHAANRANASAWVAVCRQALGNEDSSADCHALAELEAQADAATRVADAAGYVAALAAWRERRLPQQPPCRTRPLGAAFCARAEAKALLRIWGVEEDSTAEAECCACLAEWFAPRYFFPYFFWHAETDLQSNASRWFFDADYAEAFASAGHLAPPFGPPQIPWHKLPQGHFRLKRLMNLQVLRLLRGAIPGTELSGIRQVVDFGIGTGDAAAMLLDMNYSGTVLMYDNPHVMVLARYWQRYSGVPSLLGDGLEASPDAARGGFVLESSFASLSAHVDRSQLFDSLFLATYSLSEADGATRAMFLPLIKDFGVVIMTFGAAYVPGPNTPASALDNRAFLEPFVRAMNDTHEMMAWQVPYLSYELPHFYFVAVHRDRGKLACVAALNCRANTLHPRWRS